MSDVIILGAGIAGISAGYHANLLGKRAEIYEATDSYGGLLDNFSIDGFRFDKAVHLSFTGNEIVRKIFDQVDYYNHIPHPVNYEDGLWLKHPVQANLFPLPVEDKVKAIQSFLDRPSHKDNGNYRDWLLGAFGEYITNRFPGKFTKKYWTVPADQLNCDWIGDRLYSPSLEELLFGAMTDKTPNTYYARNMRYPKKGGYKTFLSPMVRDCDIHLEKRAATIDTEKKFIEFSDSSKVYYQNLISTIPLPEIIKLIKDVPEIVRLAATKLIASSIRISSIGFNDPDVAQHLWFYIYDEKFLTSRVNSPSMKSPDSVPANCSSLQFETYHSTIGEQPVSEDQLQENIMSFLNHSGIAENGMVQVYDCRTLEYGNVIFTHTIAQNRKIVLEYLASKDIDTAGRFGEWDYLWSDQSLLSGKRAAENIMLP